MKNKIKEMDIQIDAYHSARIKVDELRKDIALQKCPLKKGDTITYTKNQKKYSGIIEEVLFVVKEIEFLGPSKGNEVGWGVCGKKILKATGKPGNYNFGINEFSHFLKDGIWQEKEGSLSPQEKIERAVLGAPDDSSLL
ncbi:hypothetical protein V4F78_003878 [Serratia marcescens]